MSYRRNYYYSRRRSGKYSNETICVNTAVTEELDGNVTFPYTEDAQHAVTARGLTIVPATNVFGTRKVKNFTIRITADKNDDQIFGALVYVPEGTLPQPLQVGGTSQSLYEPNQNVIATFIIPPNCKRDVAGAITDYGAPTQITVSTRLARNLSSGDHIALLFASPNGLTAGDGTGGNPESVTLSGTVNYAIKY